MLASALVFAAQPSIAVFYGVNPPWDELHAFDAVVVEPLHVPDPTLYSTERTALFAYVAVGEVSPERDYSRDIPSAWKLGNNPDWGSMVVDQAQPEWPAFFAERVIKPLWEAGFRGFFLDTLDSYRLHTQTAAEKVRQEAGLIAVIRELKRRYPQAKLIFNRGFEILPQVHQDVYAVAAESLFQRWDAAQQHFVAVPPVDREWLLGQLNHIRQDYHLPVLSIDYVPPGQRDLARATAARISDLGFIPWVSNPELDMLGVGEIEVMPRKVLMVHNSANTEYDLNGTSVLHYATMPLNYLGYSAEYLDARRTLPAEPLTGRYAGIVVWLDRAAGREGAVLHAWLTRQKKAGIPIVILGDGAFLFGNGDAAEFGLAYSKPANTRMRLHVVQRDALVGFEAQPVLDRTAFFPVLARDANVLLTLANERNEQQDAIALTGWGGYALNPQVLVELPSVRTDGRAMDISRNMRWVINPIEFLRRALKLPDMPVPDVTTENGRRVLMVHMDGDGFANRGEFPGAPYAADVLLKQILKKYPVPMTLSVIQGEIAPDGLYPAQSAALEGIARAMFVLPHVEIASHSLSHPFYWRKAVANPEEEGYHLKLNNYEFDLQQEIAGSIAYIETRLAPPGKKVKVFLWTGDTNIGSDALALAAQAGVASMNGGETTITRSFPTLTLVAPLGVAKGGVFQVYAPNQNENVYTNNWLGPFYGYERVIETYEMTDAPYRLKPVDVYFHTYSASKPASLKALERVFEWALAQPLTPVHVSDYVRRVQDFNQMVVARTREGWRVRGSGELRELRAPVSLGQPVIHADSGVAGFNRYDNQHYLHLGGSEASIRFRPVATAAPYLVSANARIERVTSSETADGTTVKLALRGHVPLQFELSLGARCGVQADGRAIRADSAHNGVSYFFTSSHVIDQLRIHCPR
ncbi:bifunctional glycoside hydrolase 114/ polysaccharide deacetylase family protein [Ferrigenium sp. UT5]|uniref:bifunctional glycoside hydrolase 114/ polysaccharide deacetylase family protein n=1 Tax=Ferrigenium sp. UT5 TaxID=3242105 RepID=UPI0038B238C0